MFPNDDIWVKVANQDFSKNLLRAENGDPRAQYLIARVFLFGNNEIGVDEDQDKGVYWMRKSADQGAAEAQYAMAMLYRNGVGLEKDAKKWEKYMTLAGEQNFSRAMIELSDAYRDGAAEIGVEPNEKKYVYWLRKEAEAGVPISIRNLAWRYREGLEVEKDIDKAFEWIMKGVQADDGAAQAYAAEFFENGLGTEKDLVKAYMLYDLSTGIGREAKQKLAKKMTDDQIREAIARSWQWQLEHGVVRPSSDGYQYRYPLEESD
nr:tetratricopeptide repeat protein [Marinobacter oulmenensis]